MNKARKLPPSQLIALADAATYLGYSIEQLHVMASIGELEIIDHDASGRTIPVVTLPEIERMKNATAKQPERFNPTERRTALYLIGVLARLYAWGEEGAEMHYTLRDLLEGDAEKKGIGMLRSRETDAVLLREALGLVKAAAISPAERKAA